MVITEFGYVLNSFKDLVEFYRNEIVAVDYYDYPFEEIENTFTSNCTWDLDPIVCALEGCEHRVLDLFCGSGRVAYHLAANDFLVTGYDKSTSSLARFESVGLESDWGNEVDCVAVDFLDEKYLPNTQFHTVVIGNLTCNSFSLKNSLDIVFSNLKKVLYTNGKLVLFGVSVDPKPMLSAYKGSIMPVPHRMPSGISSIMWTALEYSPETRLLTQNCFIEISEKSKTNRYFSTIRERFWLTSEICCYLEKHGFEIERTENLNVGGGGIDGLPTDMIIAKHI